MPNPDLSRPLPPWLSSSDPVEALAVGPFVITYRGTKVPEMMRGVPQLGAFLRFDEEDGWTWDEATRRRYLGKTRWTDDGQTLRGVTEDGFDVEVRPLVEEDADALMLDPAPGEALYMTAWRALVPDWLEPYDPEPETEDALEVPDDTMPRDWPWPR